MRLSLLFRSLLPGFLPLIVFALVESLWGESAGLTAGLAIGAGELIFVLVRDRKADPFVAADTLLLALAGGLSLALENEIFFKLKPAIMELILAGGLGLLLVLPADRMSAYLQHQLRGLEIPGKSLDLMRSSLGRLLVVLGLHVALTVWAALAWSTAVWAFVSGGLLYIMFGLVVAAEFLFARLRRRGQSTTGTEENLPEEIIPLVDEAGRITGSAPRSQCHRGPGRLHPVIHLHIHDGRGGLLLQKRAKNKLIQPGRWDTAVGGHVSAGEDLAGGLYRELAEELGITPDMLQSANAQPRFLRTYRWDTELESELVYVFDLEYSGPLRPDRREVSQTRFWTSAEIRTALGTSVLTPNFEFEFGQFFSGPSLAQTHGGR